MQRVEKCDIIEDVKVLLCDVVAIVMLFHILLVRDFSYPLGIKFTYIYSLCIALQYLNYIFCLTRGDKSFLIICFNYVFFRH